MSTGTFDPVQYKQVQKRDWTDAAPGWRTWWPKFESGVGVVSERLVDLAELAPGDRVLDVATGLGEPALTAARRVAPGGRVVATDIAPGMIALARERAAEAGVDNVEFVEVDAEELDLAEGEFDAVLSRWGFMFLPDLPGALARMRRVLVPGGRLAAAVWTEPERSPMVALAFRVASQRLELPPPGPGVPGPFSLADLPALEAVISAAGFEDVRSERVAIQVEYESAEEYGAFMRGIAAPIHGMLAGRPQEEAESVWDAIVDAARQFEEEGGRIVLPGESGCVTGRAS